jgi:transposase
MKELFPQQDYSWNSVYHHYQKWSSDGTWIKLWQRLLDKHREKIDMSTVQLDGSHTPVKRGGAMVGYQGRKKAKTSNLLFLTDNKGLPLTCSSVIAGNHNDVFELKAYMNQMKKQLEQSNLSFDGIFMNADAGFDCFAFKNFCMQNGVFPNVDRNWRNGVNEEDPFVFDEELYERRYVIERTNAWLDAFKTLLIRFETNDTHWRTWHFIAFIVILLR